MCTYGGRGYSQEIAGYGMVRKPDAAGYIMPTARVTPEEQARMLAEARAKDAAATGTQDAAATGTQDPREGGLLSGMSVSRNAGLRPAIVTPSSIGEHEAGVRNNIILQNQQSDRDMAFVRANPGYLAKNEAKAPNTAAATNRPVGGSGGSSVGSSLLVPSSTQNALNPATKPNPNKTLLGG